MGHNIEAYYAASELAKLIDRNQKSIFKVYRRPGKWLISASRSKDRDWPYADAMICASNGSTSKDVKIAIEYKKQSEGIHGILTAIGQAYSYLAKGYEATILVIPNTYNSYSDPGSRIVDFINTANKNSAIAVYTYDPIHCGKSTFMFRGNLKEIRKLDIKSSKISSLKSGKTTDTIWTHFREGSTEYGDIYYYCLTASNINDSEQEDLSSVLIPKELIDAVKRIDASAEPYQYLSNSTKDISRKNRVWRHFWFNYMFNKEIMPIYKKTGGTYIVNDTKSKIPCNGGADTRQFFSKNSGSIKQKLIEELIKGSLSEDEAWEKYAKNVRNRAHSYRIDVEAFSYGIDMVDENAELTHLGYRYVHSCKDGDPFKGLPKMIYESAYLNNGNLNAFLQFFYQVSEEFLEKDIFMWSKPLLDNKENVVNYRFDSTKYREDIEDKFYKDLHILRKVSSRTGTKRPALKAEIYAINMMGLSGEYRISCGLPINWLKVQALNDFYNSNKLYEL